MYSAETVTDVPVSTPEALYTKYAVTAIAASVCEALLLPRNKPSPSQTMLRKNASTFFI